MVFSDCRQEVLPGQSEMGSNFSCSTLGGQPCSPCRQIKKIDSEIADAEARIVELKTRHIALQENINLEHSPFLRRILIDVLSEIFLHCLPELEPINFLLLKPPDRTPLELARVCRTWRATAL